MSRRCGICTHPERAAIEAAILVGDTYRTIGTRFGLGKSAVARHAANHVRHDDPPAVAAAIGQSADQVGQLHSARVRTYRCTRYPSYTICERVKFVDGRFATDDPHLQQLVEINPWFGRFIVRERTKQRAS